MKKIKEMVKKGKKGRFQRGNGGKAKVINYKSQKNAYTFIGRENGKKK